MSRFAIVFGLVGLLLPLGVACDEDTGGPGTDATSGGDGPRDGAADGWTGDGPGGDGPGGDGPGGDGPGGDGPTVDSGTTPWPDGFFLPDGSNPGNMPACWGKVYACGDTKDNDGDKLIDAADPDCTGPCDNDESSLELLLPGVNMDPCKQDCYWDNNSGKGNDDCQWNHKCDPLGPGAKLTPSCPYDKTYKFCTKTQSAKCLKVCLPLVPNGCDCFGCCEMYTSTGKYPKTVFLGSGTKCSTKTPGNCAPCTQIKACTNGCGPCELCLGKTLKDLPAWCFKKGQDAGVGSDSGTPTKDSSTGPTDATTGSDALIPGYPWTCPPGVDPCTNNSHCQFGYYCITGCCQKGIS